MMQSPGLLLVLIVIAAPLRSLSLSSPFYEKTLYDAIPKGLEKGKKKLEEMQTEAEGAANDVIILFKNGTEEQKASFERMYASLMQQFDVEGYNSLMDAILTQSSQHRFQTAVQKLGSVMPHCDGGGFKGGGPLPKIPEHVAPYPGGALRRTFGFDLSQWMFSQLMTVQSAAGAQNPILGMMAMMAITTVIGIVQTVLASVIDIVPPMIPPPIWILRPFPCLPMLLGPNCIGSVLYPVSLPDFITASTTDQIMNGVISSFPAKYNSKIGKTNESSYRLCAVVYLGMYCASIFPMCWLPIGLQEAQVFPICFPQCLLVLVACPGFWLDDILGPCKAISSPPFCSFSAFINLKSVPPQYVKYEEAYLYPATCPEYDPAYDAPPDLYDVVKPLPSPFIPGPPPQIAPGKSLVKSLDDFANIQEPYNRVCSCDEGCKLRDGATEETECAKECQKTSTAPPPTHLRRPATPQVVYLDESSTPSASIGHVIPVTAHAG